ncbi:glycoside hydrolase [Rhodanobacter sp. 7MK24]|uniref:glycosyl hydrolase family 95 catalytic domain-containing protein n=1 Tax=Rhodanobacter sp. 7MK24 TaxID=2775922 RepID=UPI00178611DB|nr:glycoside hydrolase [Rhodanobacter sp. 7MK24]MBD8880336.1 glycoside hydrolase [Rhodanobacter sp. 7MK24]
MKRTVLATLAFATGLVISVCHAADATTAWHDQRFNADVGGVVSRSDIVLKHANLRADEAMPLGNGRLGLAVWSQDGLTLQLNRADTLPGRLSPGQVVFAGLKPLAKASDYAGRLALHDGEFRESGAGMQAMVYVQPDTDVAVVEVHGADPNVRQSVLLHLWQPRKPQAMAQQGVAVLAETWKDDSEAGASGQTFGSLAAITAHARDVHAQVQGPQTVELSFKPEMDGSFRVLVAAPEWEGGDALRRAQPLLANAGRIPDAAHRDWWNAFWLRAGLMKLGSADGSAEYIENLRAIDLYATAAESRGPLPGSQAGIADLFASTRDQHRWAPSAYWHWNLRMQVAANLGAGLYELNAPYFNLYRSNLANIEAWTRAQMDGRPGACVPETMRFNGRGYENESWMGGPGINCSAKSLPYYNARTLSTGAEVSLWIWQQYLATQDRTFLAANYPVMAASARFLLAYARPGVDGLRHTFPSNAHETQWDVHDPTTDIAAMKAVFPVIIEAAQTLHTDAALVAELRGALPKIPAFPLQKSGDGSVIGPSYDAGAEIQNTENIGLEPVWPYALIDEDGPQHALGVHTYLQRPNKFENDWSYDPLQAARLGLADEVKTALLTLTGKYQQYPSGFAKFTGGEFYVEQIGVVAATLQDALVQDHDGLIRIAPAWPKGWNADATVYIKQSSKVDLQIRDGVPGTVVIEAGADGRMTVRNPWPGKSIEAVESGSGKRVAGADKQNVLSFDAQAGNAYLIQRVDQPSANLPYAAINGSAASEPKTLGTRHIGLP